MPRRPLRVCSHPGCPRLTESGTCPAHQRQRRRVYDEARGSFRERGYTSTWDKISRHHREVEPLCRHCAAAGRLTPATVVDHITPKRDGGTDEESNLQSLCNACHAAKTRREGPR